MLFLVVAFAGLGGFMFGYDLGVIAGALLYMGLRDADASLVVAAAKFGAVCGTFVGGALMQEFGRRPAMACTGVFFLLGPLAMASASAASIPALVVGRLLVGLGVGASAVVVPAYAAEMAPAERRGAVVVVYELMLCFGMIAASLADFALRDARENWRWMLALPAVPAVAVLCSFAILPESPRWLVRRGRLRDALAVIESLREGTKRRRGGGDPAETERRLDASTARVEAELMELWSASEKEAATTSGIARDPESTSLRGGAVEMVDRDGVVGDPRGAALDDDPGGGARGALDDEDPGGGPPLVVVVSEKSSPLYSLALSSRRFASSLRSVLRDSLRVSRDPRSRRAFRVASTLAFFNQACASTAVINYAPTILERAGTADRGDAVFFASGVSLAKLVGVGCGVVLVDALGRRPLLIYGSVFGAASLLVLAVAYESSEDAAFASLLAMCSFMLAFSVSWAGVFWVVVAELFDATHHAAATSATLAWMFFVGAAVDAAFLPAADALGGGVVFAALAAVLALGGAYAWAELPETKGKTLAEVHAEMAREDRDDWGGGGLGGLGGGGSAGDGSLGGRGDTTSRRTRR